MRSWRVEADEEDGMVGEGMKLMRTCLGPAV